ncbi:putative oxoglutarate dehydrogenase (succinyl-transferring) [Helianthus annuus]|nr:putative oxoglutarate dehydrogenase (succinyl-transferring) [Helianthus annuus]
MEPTLSNQIQTCNIQIVNVTTPTNYFHVFELHKEFHKPLIIMSSKKMLRHKDYKLNLFEFDDVFKVIIPGYINMNLNKILDIEVYINLISIKR